MANTDRSEQNASLLPMAVFLDTNVLDALPESLESAELSGLVEKASWVFVPDVVAREWCAHRWEKARNSALAAAKAQKHLQQYSAEWVNLKIGDGKELYRMVLALSAKRMRAARLRVLGPPRPRLRDIIACACLKVPPFKGDGRGFKDEMIVQSILALFARRQYKSCLLITSDSDFGRDVIERLDALGVKLLVARNLTDAHKLLDGILTAVAKAGWQAKNSAVVELARANWDGIRDSLLKTIDAEGVPQSELFPTHGKKDLPEHASMTRLVSFTPREVSGVFAGAACPGTGRVPVTVFVECEIEAEYELANWLGDILARKVTMDGVAEPVARPKPERQVGKLTRSFAVYAVVSEKPDGSLFDFSLIESREYWAMLDEIRHSGPGKP